MIFLLYFGIVFAGFMFGLYGILFAPTVDENENPTAGPGLSPVSFPEYNYTLPNAHPSHRPLYIHKTDMDREIITCWKLSVADRIRLLITGRLWVSNMTWGESLQPLYLTTLKTDVLRSVTQDKNAEQGDV